MLSNRFISLMLALLTGAAALAAAEAGPEAAEERLPLPNFQGIFSGSLLHLRQLDHYAAEGTLHVHYHTGEHAQELEYHLRIEKHAPHQLAITVLEPETKVLVYKLTLTAARGPAQLYLPRDATLMTAGAALAGEFADSLTLALVIPLFEFLEYTRPDRWFSRIGEVEAVSTERTEGGAENYLRFMLNNYFSLRDFTIEMWTDDGEEPLPQRMAVDLARSLAERGFGGVVPAGADLFMDLHIHTWALDAAPGSSVLEAPGGGQDFEAHDIGPLLAAEGEAMLADVSLLDMLGGAGGLPQGGNLPAGLPRGQLPSRSAAGGQMPSAAERAQIISQLRNASPAERERLVQELRSQYGGGARARGGAAQRMRGTPQRTQGVNNTTRGSSPRR